MAYAVEAGKHCGTGYGLRIVAEPPSTEVKRWCFTQQEMIARAPAWIAARAAQAPVIEPGGITPPAEAVTVNPEVIEAGVAPSGSFALMGIPWWAWAGGAVGVWFIFFRKN